MARILVVDDAPFARAVACKHLRSAGFETLEAAEGREALTVLSDLELDAIVTDLLMPNMGGMEFMKVLRRNGNTVPIVVLTADIQERTFEACQELGCAFFLNKPVKRKSLIEAVRLAVAHKEAV